jgi:hypothetical protein
MARSDPPGAIRAAGGDHGLASTIEVESVTSEGLETARTVANVAGSELGAR